MAQKRRIFLADPRDLNSHSCHKTTKLRQTDSIYLICEEATKEPLPDYLRDFFSDKQVFVHTEDLTGFLREHCTGKEAIYFIGPRMEKTYEDISDELLNYCDGVGKNATFGVKNVKLKKLEQQTVDDYLINNITNAISHQEFPVVSEQSQRNSLQEEKVEKESIAYNETPVMGRTEDWTGMDYPVEAINVDDRSGVSRENPEQKIPTPQENRERPVNSIPKEETFRKNETRKLTSHKPSSDNQHRKPPRKNLTGDSNKKDTPKVQTEHTNPDTVFEGMESVPDRKTSDAKARLMAALLERICGHIEAVMVRKMDIDECFQLMLTILKSESAGEAAESWKCLQPAIPLKLTVGEFSAIKSEAVYYNDVSNILYAEDVWNY